MNDDRVLRRLSYTNVKIQEILLSLMKESNLKVAIKKELISLPFDKLKQL